MSSTGSITRHLLALKKGDGSALTPLWARFFQKLARFARSRLTVRERTFADEEDVVLSVFRHLYDGVVESRFEKLANRDDFWRILITMTAQKVIDQRRYVSSKRRGGGRVLSESVAGDLDYGEVLRGAESPDILAELKEESQRLVGLLGDPKMQRIAELRLDGKTNKEIADATGMSPRSVIRKTRLIHQKWSAILNAELEARQ